MSLGQVLILILAIIILVCLFIYFFAGEISYKICLKRRAMAEKIINYEMEALANKLYKIDYDWWKKYNFEKVCVEGHNGEKLYPLFLKYHDSNKVAIIIHGYFARFEENEQIC